MMEDIYGDETMRLPDFKQKTIFDSNMIFILPEREYFSLVVCIM